MVCVYMYVYTSVYHHPALVLMTKKDYMYHAKMDLVYTKDQQFICCSCVVWI